MVRLVIVCSMIFFLEIKRYQTFIVLKGATYVVFVFRSLLHWCFYVLVLYSKPVPVWLSVWFLPIEQVLFVSIQVPGIRYVYHLHSRYDFSIFRLIVTPLISNNIIYITSQELCISSVILCYSTLQLYQYLSGLHFWDKLYSHGDRLTWWRWIQLTWTPREPIWKFCMN